MHRQLRQYTAFSGLDSTTLQSLARHANQLDLPAGRWLVRRGRSLPDIHYLVRGSVKTFMPERVIRADRPLARQAVYPGAREVLTLTDCRFLQLHPSHLEQDELLAADNRVPELLESEDCWQLKFLQTHLMTSLSPAIWQKVLRQLNPVEVDAGDRVIVEGDGINLQHCFILASGRARVISRDRRLCDLEPGDLFGEDALISDRPRNASVRMLEAGRIMSLQREHFREFLLELFESGGLAMSPELAAASKEIRVLDVGAQVDLRDRVASLDPNLSYRVRSRDPGLCALALFLIRQRGLQAWS
jgi:CRP-like cAMP-binding protein